MISRVVAIVSTSVAVALFVVLLLSAASEHDKPVSDQARIFDDALGHIQESFVDKNEFTKDQLLGAAIRGLIKELDDPYSSYATPQSYELAFNYSGKFDGIGAEVTMRDGQVLIVAPLDGTPAEHAGLRPGDIILGVDGQSIDDLSLLETVLKIRGPKGSTVVLSVLRTGSSDPFDVGIVRDTITPTSVTSRILEEAPAIGYVRLSTFVQTSPSQLSAAIAQLKTAGAEALVLDLRNNPGGLVDAALGVISEFMDDRLAVALVNSDGERREFKTSEGGGSLEIPLVVLVNAFSASASELTAGAIQDYERGTIIGARTFGKGSFNTLYKLENAGGLYLTTGRWLTPSGRLIEGDGLEPDVQVGPVVDMRGLLSVGHEVRALCDAAEAFEGGAGRNEELLETIAELCSVESPSDDGPTIVDEVLQVAVRVLNSELGY